VNTLFGNFSILTPPFWYDKLTLVSTKSIIPHMPYYAGLEGLAITPIYQQAEEDDQEKE
jgi:hypothetical protein